MNSADYVIVGAGAAGCALAARLSEDATVRVVLLEAGGPDTNRASKIPAAFATLFKTDYDWNYTTVPQAHVDDRELYWPRGRVLGGSTAINAMIVQRGHPGTYDEWARLGNEPWSYDEVLPYFRRLESFEGGADEYHGAEGPMPVQSLRSPNRLCRALVEAAQQAGYAGNDDFNAGEQTGFGFYHVNQRRGERVSAATAYLKPALQRENLHAETHALATRIAFEGRRAVGVVYQQDGQEKLIRADREVLLCGGAVNSPQLLLLSGIGPADHLHAHDIDVLSDLPGVGANLQDHLNIPVGYYSTQPISLAAAQHPWQLVRYVLQRRGLLTSNAAEGGGFVRLDPEATVPELQFHTGSLLYENHALDGIPGHGFGMSATLVQPYSRGTIRLQSNDPQAAPRIDPQYLSDERDVATLVRGVEIVFEIFDQAAVAPFRGALRTPTERPTDAEARRAHIRANVETLYHPVGTCKMGQDADAVVNDRLQVHTVEGLRVVDASIMPTITNANTAFPSIMIGERAADLIRAQ